MLESLNTPEIHRIALIVGAIVATHYKNIYNVIPGGAIVPGVLVILFLNSPIWCLTVIILSFGVYYTYDRWLRKASYKRRTPMYILAVLSLGIAHPLSIAYIQLGLIPATLTSLSGALVPAIVAFSYTRQNIDKVSWGILITTAITAVIMAGIYVIGAGLLGLEFDTLAEAARGEKRLSINYPFIQFYIMLAVGYLIYRRAGIRAGGYVVAPAAAALLVQPVSALTFLSGCLFVYLATKAIVAESLVVGLNRYALALYLTTAFVWGIEIVFLQLDPTILPFQGSSILAIIAMFSYVNDSILYEDKSVHAYMGGSLAIAITMTVASKAIEQVLL